MSGTDQGRSREGKKKKKGTCESFISNPVPNPSHLSLSKIVVDHREVEAQLLHVALVALEEKKVAIHLRVQRRQVVDVHVCTGSQKFGQEEAGKGQLHQHVLIQRLERNVAVSWRTTAGQGYKLFLVNPPTNISQSEQMRKCLQR